MSDTTEKTLRKLKSLRLCLQAHPDNEPNSEFADRIDDLDEMIAEMENAPVAEDIASESLSGDYDYEYFQNIWAKENHYRNWDNMYSNRGLDPRDYEQAAERYARYMAAKAWEEGYDKGYDDGYYCLPGATNPYKQ